MTYGSFLQMVETNRRSLAALEGIAQRCPEIDLGRDMQWRREAQAKHEEKLRRWSEAIERDAERQVARLVRT